MAIMNFGGVLEEVFTRDEFPVSTAREFLDGKTIAILGYGSQGPAQSKNANDQGFNVIVGQRTGSTYEQAKKEGWVPGETLFSIEEAAQRGDIVVNLLSDAAQKSTWIDTVLPALTPGKTLMFSHGFSIAYPEKTGVEPPQGVDTVLVAPKGFGRSVRELFQNGSGINVSMAVEQDATGKAWLTAQAMARAIGAGYGFKTTFQKEVFSDLTGERSFLLGQMWAIAESYYEHIRPYMDSASNAFLASSHQITQVILPILGHEGAMGIYRRANEAGALNEVVTWQQAVREASRPTLEKLYDSVVAGVETEDALVRNSQPDYRANLESQLAVIRNHEMGQVGLDYRNEVSLEETAPERTGIWTFNNIEWALAGAIIGAMEAQYQLLIDKEHSPSEAFNETVEEATQSLIHAYRKNGIEGLIGECSTTAQVGALNWGPVYKDALLSAINKTKASKGDMASLAVGFTSPNIWKVGETVLSLRPQYN